MNPLMRRLEKLESTRKPEREVDIIMRTWVGDSPLFKASCKGNDLYRNADEIEDQFRERVAEWAKCLPHNGLCQQVFVSREDDEPTWADAGKYLPQLA